MAKFSEIIYAIRDLPRGGDGESDDNAYTERFIAYLVNNYRAVLLRREMDAGKELTEYYKQSLGTVELVKAQINECGLPDCDLGTSILRTLNPIPKAVDSSRRDALTYVGLVDGSHAFQRTHFNKLAFEKYARYTGKRTKFYEMSTDQGTHIYIINPPIPNMRYITINGVWEDPTLANNYKTCGNTGNCFVGYEYEYPISITLLDSIYKMIASSEFATQNILAKDTSNDGVDENLLQDERKRN